MYLEKTNAHIRDKDITFEEGPHIYTVKGDSSFKSVTTFVHSHFSHFDSEYAIQKILNGNKINDPSYKYYNMNREQILAQWEKKTYCFKYSRYKNAL